MSFLRSYFALRFRFSVNSSSLSGILLNDLKCAKFTVSPVKDITKTNSTRNMCDLSLLGADIHKDVPDDILLPPAHVKGMKLLDRNAFTKDVSVPFVKIPLKDIHVALKILNPFLLKMTKFQPVIDCDCYKKILLNPLTLKHKFTDVLACLKTLKLEDIAWTNANLKYENWLHSDILKAVLPEELGDGVSAFSIIGQILHLNLKESYKDYKQIIGQILLDKHPRLRTVVNKVNTIENTFRNFEMEVLAGEPDFEVKVKENGFTYQFDFSKVFWNCRLCAEHVRICKKFSCGDIVFDVFAGVGPFAIPAAKTKCIVYANDLNPDSYKWLIHNAKLNKVGDYLNASNLDGRHFIQTVVKDELTKFYKQYNQERRTIHILMNLPACALEFLDAFENLLIDCEVNENILTDACRPVLYCYFFLKLNSEVQDKQELINKYLSSKMQQGIENIEKVRSVAPNKEMHRLTMHLPICVLFGKNVSNEPAVKKMKLS